MIRSVSIMLWRERCNAWRMPSVTLRARVEVLHCKLRFLVAVAEREERIDDVAPRPLALALDRDRPRCRACLSIRAGGVRPFSCRCPGIFVSRPLSCSLTARFTSATLMPESTASAVRAPTPEILRSCRNKRALAFGEEAVELVRVLAHDEMREQRHVRPGRRQLVERAHRHVELVAHAMHVDHDLRRLLRDELAGEPPDHTSLPWCTRKPAVATRPRPCPPCAWQIAQASASAASAARRSGEREQALDHLLHLFLSRVSVADHRLLHLERACIPRWEGRA